MSSVVSEERLLVLGLCDHGRVLGLSSFSSLSPFTPHANSSCLLLVGNDWERAGLQCRWLSVSG